MNDTNKAKLKKWKADQFAAEVSADVAESENAARTARIMRRLGKSIPEEMLVWQSLMALRATMDKEAAPTLTALRQAEQECFQVKFAVTAKAAPVTAKQPKLPLKGYEYTPDWWKEAAQREKEARKRGEVSDE